MIATASMVFLGVAPASATDAAVDPTTIAASAEAAAPATESAPAEAPAPAPATTPAPAPAEAPAEAPVIEPTPAATPAPTTAPASPTEPQASAAQEAPAAATSIQPTDESSTPEEASIEEATVESTEPQPPYLRWSVISNDGTVQPNVALHVQGPRDNSLADDGADSQWATALTMTVRDNSGQPDYIGADRDPAPGEFLVKQLTDDANASRTYDVQANEIFRVQPTEVPDGFTTDAETWQDIEVSDTANDVADKVTLAQPAVERLLAAESAPEFEVMSAPPGAEELGVYHAEYDSNDPLTWYSSGSPAQATKINSFTSAYTKSGQNYILGATWTRPSATGTKGWSIEYTVAPERWGHSAGTLDVPQPNRSQGGMVIIVENSNQQNYTTQRCLYTSLANYPGTCSTIPNAISSDDGGFTMKLSLTLDPTFVGVQGCPSTLGSTGYIRSWTGNRQIQAWAAPVSVDPPSNCGKIVINKQVLRSVPTDRLEGATFQLRNTNANGSMGSLITDPWATCRIAASPATSCTITLPNSAAHDKSYWVEEISSGIAANKTFPLGHIATGTPTGALTSQPYPGNTGNVAAGSTVQMPRTSVSGPGNDNLSSIGKTTNAIQNPPFAGSCAAGLDIGLVLDLSSSIDDVEAAQYANSVRSLVKGLVTSGNYINIGTITFNSSATFRPGLSGVASNDLADDIHDFLSDGTNYIPATNWDAALTEAAGRGFDIVLMLTDGAPTQSRATATAGNVRFFHVENAVLSSNELKNVGTLVWAVGVALPGGSVTNLKAISGLNEGDYFTSEWAELQTKLSSIAKGLTCQVPITVNKTEVAFDGTTTPLAGGWQFTTTKTSASAPGTVSGTPTQTTVANDATPTSWNYAFTEATQTAGITVEETLQAGWTLESVSCVINGTTTLPATITGNTWTTNAFSVGDSVSCTATNRELPQEVGLTVTKSWVVNGVTYANGSQPAAAGTATLTLSPLPTDVTTPTFGTEYTYRQGATVSVNETYTSTNENCTLASSKVTSVNGQAQSPEKNLPLVHTMALTPDPNTITVTNTVTCTSSLTLVKNVVINHGGTGIVSDWTLSAAGPTTPISGKTGEAAVTNRTVAEGDYTLAESGPTGGYTASAWVCVGGTTNSNVVTVPLGTHVTCTITNTDKPGAVEWSKVAAANTAALLAGSEWSLTNTTASTTVTIIDCDESPCTGADIDPVAGQFEIAGLDWGAYTATETKAPPGYTMSASFTFTVDATTAGTTINKGEITNAQQPGVDLPLTGGLSSDAFTIWGISIAAFAALLGAAYWGTRRRRQMEA